MSEDHYFSADPAVPFTRQPVVATVWGRSLSLTSGSGVFARGRLDIGTAVLFRETEPPASGRVLDLGCGYGVIGLAIAVCSPATTVTGIDVNERAVLLANENAASLGVDDRYAAVTPDAVLDGRLGDATYDEIWSNPPIRIGKEALHELLHGLAGQVGARGTSGDGGRQEPRRRLPATLAGRPGLPDRADGVGQGLQGAGVAPCWLRKASRSARWLRRPPLRRWLRKARRSARWSRCEERQRQPRNPLSGSCCDPRFHHGVSRLGRGRPRTSTSGELA